MEYQHGVHSVFSATYYKKVTARWLLVPMGSTFIIAMGLVYPNVGW